MQETLLTPYIAEVENRGSQYPPEGGTAIAAQAVVALVLAVVSLVYAFKSFDFIYIMTFGGPGTASTTLPFLSYHLAFEIYRYSQGAAVAVVTLAIVLVLAAVYIRQVRREERA